MGGGLSDRGPAAATPANASNSQKQEEAALQPAADRAVDPAMSILKPFVLLACVAFTVGFVGYWALMITFVLRRRRPKPVVSIA